MKRSRGLHYTQVPCHFLSAGTLQMVSEHSVACRIETLGLVRNKLAKNLNYFTKYKSFHGIFLLFLLSTRNSLLMHFTLYLVLPN